MIPFLAPMFLAAPAVVTAADDADAAAYFAVLTTAPSAAERSRVNTLIRSLKTSAIWPKLGRFHVLAAETSQAARTDLRTPSKSLVAVNAPTFTANRGYAGDAASAYLDFQENFNADGNYVQDSAAFGAWCNTQGSSLGARPHIGVASGTGRGFILARSGGNEIFQINDATNDVLQFGGSTRLGHRTAVRPAANSKRGYFNGVRVGGSDTPSTNTPSALGALLRNNTVYSDDQIAIAYTSAALSDQNMSDLHTHLNTYLTAKGAQ